MKSSVEARKRKFAYLLSAAALSISVFLWSRQEFFFGSWLCLGGFINVPRHDNLLRTLKQKLSSGDRKWISEKIVQILLVILAWMALNEVPEEIVLALPTQPLFAVLLWALFMTLLVCSYYQTVAHRVAASDNLGTLARACDLAQTSTNGRLFARRNPVAAGIPPAA